MYLQRIGEFATVIAQRGDLAPHCPFPLLPLGPAIKPLALRMVWQVAQKVLVPIIGIGDIAAPDDAMEYLIATAGSMKLDMVNFNDPTAAVLIVDELSSPDGLRYIERLRKHGSICSCEHGARELNRPEATRNRLPKENEHEQGNDDTNPACP